jgi:hypothetical protein
MFLMPVAVFVILYSVPRFFELETKYEARELCATTASTVVANLTANLTSNLTAIGGDDIDGDSDDGVASSANDTTPPTATVTTSEPCPTVWEPQLGIKPLRFNPYYVSVSAKN